MMATRRQFLAQVAAGATAGVWALRASWCGAETSGMRVSACDWSLDAKGPSGVDVARTVGLDGLEVSAGDAADVLTIGSSACRDEYKAAFKKAGIVASSLAMGLLNGNPFATDPRAPAWLEQTIDAAADLDARVILMAFFGDGDLRINDELKSKDVDAVVQRLKDGVKRAEAAKVILGLENTLSAKQNLAILDRVQSDAVRVYYDVGNSTNNGYDVPAEIRLLGDRMCQIHFKDGKNFLGEGKVKMEPIAKAIHDSGYNGWVVLETSKPTGSRDADFKRNAEYVRALLGQNETKPA